MKLTNTLFCFALLTLRVAPIYAQEKPDAASPKSDPHTYRLTYTLTEIDKGKKVGIQHYSLTANPSIQFATIKLGSKVPINSGTAHDYMEVELDIFVNLVEYGNGIQVNTDVNQSSLGEGTKFGAPPIIRQTGLHDTAIVQPGKSIQIGSLDIPGSTRHLDVEVLLERIS